ncbi:MAG: hypothetical protein JSR44_10520 [Spirochaetes bacterium]|nr:hypothetical protein [Spirochaetota bacterium]
MKYNSHVGPDGTNGYLRTYYSSAKSQVNDVTDGTGIEQCKIQGSDVLCKDLQITHVEAASTEKSGAVVSAPPEATTVKPKPPTKKK